MEHRIERAVSLRDPKLVAIELPVSRETVSKITDSVLEEMAGRPMVQVSVTVR